MVLKITQLSEAEDQAEVIVKGVVVALKEITTKSGYRMGFATLEDCGDTVDIVVFSDKYSDAATLLKSDYTLLIKGTLQIGDSGPRISVEGKDDVSRYIGT